VCVGTSTVKKCWNREKLFFGNENQTVFFPFGTYKEHLVFGGNKSPVGRDVGSYNTGVTYSSVFVIFFCTRIISKSIDV